VNCTACHRTFAPANSDPLGSVRIDVSNYAPGVKQTIKVTVAHPQASRWGFQLSARLVSDETKIAGNFAPNDVARVICDDGSARGVLAPCPAGQPEFAEHFNAPRTDVGAGFTFSIDWTPPATDVGDIVFYAAGNAANGDGTPNNDRIYTTVRRISAPCNLTQKPTVKSVSNGASFQAPWNTGAMVSIFGSNFGSAGKTRLVTGGDIVSNKFPQSLGCMAVTVNGVNAPITYVQQDQINVQAPALSGIGSASVVVIANPGAPNELRSDALTVTSQQAFAPAFFTFNGTSIAATSIDGTKILAAPSVVPSGTSAKPGDPITLYATGLGQTNPVFSPGDVPLVAAPVTSPVTITVGGVTVPPADILYAGVSPQSICGLQQLNVKLPATLPDGDAVVTISAGGVQSAVKTTVPIKN
jgi:uncharacterized protein (TIGR03437 family)